MQKLKLDITIGAPREEVWDAIVDDVKYRRWTSAFHEGSFFEGGWNKGEAIRFVAFNEKGEKEGMLSEIAESRYPSFISIKHIGIISGGKEDTTSDEVKKWAPSFENYTLEDVDGNKTHFIIEMDIDPEHYEMFMKLWPPALQKLKEVAEEFENAV